MVTMRNRGALLVAFAATAIFASASSAQGAVTIGTNFRWPADEINPGCSAACTIVNTALPAADTALGGLSSPVNGTVTSWTFKSVHAGDVVNLRILRPAGGMSFTGAGTSAPATSDGSGLPHGPFSTSLPIRIGDNIGLNGSANATLLGDALGPVPELYWNMPQLADGQTQAGTTGTREVMVQAVVQPANTLGFGKVKRSRKKGTATLTVDVPNAGVLDFSGAGIKIAEAAAVKTVTAPGQVKFKIKARGKKRKRLDEKGKVKVLPRFTFTPNNGTAATSSTKITLRKNL
jgi:hypothetical protein